MVGRTQVCTPDLNKSKKKHQQNQSHVIDIMISTFIPIYMPGPNKNKEKYPQNQDSAISIIMPAQTPVYMLACIPGLDNPKKTSTKLWFYDWHYNTSMPAKT